MFPRSLRHRLIILFVAVLVFAFGAMIAVNHLFWKQTLQHRDDSIIAASRLVRGMVGGIAPPDQPFTPYQRAALLSPLNDIAQSFHGIAWIETMNGEFVMGSRGISTIPDMNPRDTRNLGQVTVSDKPGAEGYSILLTIPVEYSGRKGVFKVLTRKREEMRFVIHTLLVVFLLIACLAAVMLFALSKRLVGPLKKLEHSALRLAEGDLDHRAEVSRMTELARLANAFNTMANNLQRMLNISKHLTANVSHELRSPLARIGMAEELARQQCLTHNPRGALRSLDSLREDVDGMDQLIQKILDFSRQNYSFCLAVNPCNLAELVREAIKRFTICFESKNISVRLDLPDEAWIECLREGVLIALSNLFHNAAKYTPEGGIVRINLAQQEETTTLSVTNTFRILSEDELEDIFQPFARGTDIHVPGTGLGLAIVSRVMENHNGWAKARNTLHGLCIQLTFAARKSVAE